MYVNYVYTYVYIYTMYVYYIYIYEPTNEQTQVFGGCYLKGSEPIKNLVYHSKKRKATWKQPRSVENSR